MAAARARVVELVQLGWAPERIAKEMGRSLRWVKTARDEMKREIDEGVYDERTHDRLRGLAVVLGFEGESLRRSLPGGGL